MRIAPRRISAITCALVASIATVIGGAVSAAPRLQETDWAAVEEALGRSGQMMHGVMSGLVANGFAVTALHNHLNDMTPHVMYMHYEGHGDPLELATALHDALSASATPLSPASPPAPVAPPSGPQLDTGVLDGILGYTGRLNGSVEQFSVGRAETITEMGHQLVPAQGVATALNFEPTGSSTAAITGDFVLRESEVNAVASTLRASGIEVAAVHQHHLAEEPRLFYMHFWANDDAAKLASGLRAALDQTASAAPVASLAR